MGKKLNNIKTKIDQDKCYNIKEAVSLLQEHSFVNFDETIDIAMNLGVDPKHSDQMIRGVVSMPAGTGKNIKVAVICKSAKEKDAKDAGADIVGSDDIIEDIKSGQINFDVCIATPDMMPLLARVAKILGPKGLMPNPKLGTVTIDVVSAVKKAKSGQVEYRVDKAGVIHAGVGKKSFKNEDLISNINSLITAVMNAKPQTLKGKYLKSIYLSSTMGPALNIDLNTLNKI